MSHSTNKYFLEKGGDISTTSPVPIQLLPPPLTLPLPHPSPHYDLHCLVVGCVYGGHALDLHGGLGRVHVLPGDGVQEAQGASLQLLPLGGDVCNRIGCGVVLRDLY